MTEEDYVITSEYRDRQVRQYSFVLNNSKYSDKKIVTHLHLNASTEINLWLNKAGNVIGLDFIQIKDKYIDKK